MSNPTRNSEVLADFVKYCVSHPELRFWQALCAWLGTGECIYLSKRPPLDVPEDFYDTFYYERKRGA